MSHDFKLNFGPPGKENPFDTHQAPYRNFDEKYPDPGSSRYVCFVLPEGDYIALNYAYLVSQRYSPADGSITLIFTTHTVVMTGVNLLSLYQLLLDQCARQIVCIDTRYNIAGDEEMPVVNHIVCSENG